MSDPDEERYGEPDPRRERPASAADVVGAIRLAMAAGATEAAMLAVTETLLSYAPDTDPQATAPTVLFTRAIAETRGAKLEVT